MKKNFMAIDQYGETYHDLGEHPRSALLRRFNRKSAQKIYRDLADGSSVQVGYIIGGKWLNFYIEWRKP